MLQIAAADSKQWMRIANRVVAIVAQSKTHHGKTASGWISAVKMINGTAHKFIRWQTTSLWVSDCMMSF
jgi:hypothetical protein